MCGCAIWDAPRSTAISSPSNPRSSPWIFPLTNLPYHCTTLRGDSLAFGWEGQFVRNGQPEALAGFKHYDNPYCVAEFPASQMEIRFGDQAMRLNFAAG